MKQTSGRRRAARRNATQWQKLVERFEREGQTRKQFCTSHGLALSTFDLWRRKLRGAAVVTEQEPPTLFVELSGAAATQPEPCEPGWEVELELGAGVVLRVRRAVPC